MAVLYVREFDKTIVKSNTRQIRASTHFPYYMRVSLQKGLESNYLSRGDFIIGPLYEENNKVDFQFGLTGAVGEKEDYKSAIIREMGEEIGLIPENDLSLTRLETVLDRENVKTAYCINVTNCKLVPVSDNNTDKSTSPDTFDKVGCFVYGSEEEVYHLLSSDNIYHYRSNDGIIGIVAIKVEDALSILCKKIY